MKNPFALALAAIAASAMATAPSRAEVTDADVHGFTTVHEVTIAATRTEVWRAAVEDVGQWWSDDHTVSGESARLSIDAVPLGCFCETLGERAAAVHLTVTFVNPGVLLRMSGGLGPLGLLGVDGNMTWELSDAEGGTLVTFTYAVGGYRPGGLAEIAGPVDMVVADALERLKAYIEKNEIDSDIG